MYNEIFMKEAVNLARQCFETGSGGPFGAVVVKNGIIIGKGSNAVTSSNDPTAHAEIVAIREACKHLESFQLKGCELYTSCEPCPMCLGAIYWARPDVIYYGASRKDAALAGFDDSFIYNEIALEPEERKISAEQHHPGPSLEVFKEWIAWEEKIKY